MNMSREYQLERLLAEAREELSEEIKVGKTFDVDRLPETIRLAVELVTNKAPSFSNIGALAVANFAIAETINQLKPKIVDRCFSMDEIGLNVFHVLISPSGSGKSSSLSALKTSFAEALGLVTRKVEADNLEKAKIKGVKNIIDTKPDTTVETIDWVDYKEFIKDVEDTIATGTSSRGAISQCLYNSQKQLFGSMNIVFDEFGLDLKKENTSEITQLMGEIFDEGTYRPPKHKTVDLREKTVTSMFPSMLAHTSPDVIFDNKAIIKALDNILYTLLFRRAYLSIPTTEEGYENDPIAESTEEDADWTNKRHIIVQKNTIMLNEIMIKVVTHLMKNPANRIIEFTPEASRLYTAYYNYTKVLVKVTVNPAKRIEIGTRAFKMGRVAALWSLMSGKPHITLDCLKSAIYYTEYNSKYIHDYLVLANSTPHIRLAEEFKSGRLTTLPLDKALERGFVKRVTKDFNELLQPLNSALKDNGVVKYDPEGMEFIYAKFYVSDIATGFNLSYSLDGVPKPKADRGTMLDEFQKEKTNTSMNALVDIVSMDSIYNVFLFKDKKRTKSTVIGNTKLLALDIDKSEITIDEMHELLECQHIIATTSDSENLYKFRLLLPVNVEVPCDNGVYAYICKMVGIDLLLQIDPSSFSPVQVMYGYEGSKVLMNDTEDIYNVSEFMKDFTLNGNATKAPTVYPKSATEAQRKKKVNGIISNVNTVFSYAIKPTNAWSLQLVKASKDMVKFEFNKEEYIQIIEYINRQWEIPMEDSRLQNTVINQFIGDMV